MGTVKFKVGDIVMMRGSPKLEIRSFDETGQKALCRGIERGKLFEVFFPVSELKPYRRFAIRGRYNRQY
ncbi:hypothetical protein P9A16_10815 [Shinella sp. 838]|uniref:hypothetical protein n=1 Tax=Shinella sp. 838 TaxID=3038164 RepID=UPI0024153E2C|nr:hypothetical protein [Shinella sp. 838]MDG4671620.1 hypothetical protein [Shinella sp. 838]